MPTLLLGFVHYDYSQLLSPSTVGFFKKTTQYWSDWMIEYSTENAIKLGLLINNETLDDLNSADINILDSINDDELTHGRNLVLKKLMIACLTLCLLSAITYTGACGTELSNQFLTGKFNR